jgi:pescadillo protein
MEEVPKYTLSHVIRERYPAFQDALRDMDDALCLVSLFSNFPQHQSLEIANKDIQICQKLYSEWMTYCTISQCFTKAFFSIKGIYYQVEIMGQKITWIAPYQFNQRLPFDIDYKVIGTFREFYVALLRFMNFKLYKDLGLQYPPKDIKGVSTSLQEEGAQPFLHSD